MEYTTKKKDSPEELAYAPGEVSAYNRFGKEKEEGVYLMQGHGLSGLERMTTEDAKELQYYSQGKKNVIFYVNKKALTTPKDSSRYMGQMFAKENNTNVIFTTNLDDTLAEYSDIIAMRRDPPLDHGLSYRLEKLNDSSKVFINPAHVQRYLSDKHYLNDMKSLGVLPETLISSDPKEIEEHARKLKKDYIILKPVKDSFGGEGIRRVRPEELQDEIYQATKGGKEETICQEYLEDIGRLGDKRVFLLDGEPIGAILRKPKEGSYLANVKKGGSVEKTEVTPDNQKVIDALQPMIREQGMRLIGIDLIGDKLGEVNGVSPGLLYAIDQENNQLYNPDGTAGKIASYTLNKAGQLEERCNNTVHYLI